MGPAGGGAAPGRRGAGVPAPRAGAARYTRGGAFPIPLPLLPLLPGPPPWPRRRYPPGPAVTPA